MAFGRRRRPPSSHGRPPARLYDDRHVPRLALPTGGRSGQARRVGRPPTVTAFERLGRLVVGHPRLIVAAWVVVFAAALPLAPRVAGTLRAGGFTLEDLD